MRLTQWTDYSLRMLMYCAACEGREHPPTVNEIAEAHGISRSHLTKIAMILAACGWIATTRGRGGGLRLLKPARELTLGEVIRQTETDMTLVECFDRKTNTCRLDGYCRLKDSLHKAMQGFFDTLRIELKGTGVNVLVVSPGFVATDIRQRALGANGKALGQSPRDESRGTMSVEECVRQIVRAMEHREREHLMTLKGKVIPWAKLLFPEVVDRLAASAARTIKSVNP
jgi:Rrf2 family nitric oxide-sensitive transcriptional repressor